MQYLKIRPNLTTLTLKHVCFVLLLLFLAACSSTPPEAATYSKHDSHLITVPLDSSISNLEARYGGTVITTSDTHAVLAVNLDAEQFLTLSDHAETNDNNFETGGSAWISGRSSAWAGGRSSAWAGGRSSAWAGGRSTAWAGGEFTWMPENTNTWQHIRLEEGQNLSLHLGLDIKVAVIDTGIDLDHPALIEALAPQDEWYDFVDDDPLPQEEGVFGEGGYGHGTNVAGIVRQIAPRATILPLRVLGPDGSGYLSDIVKAIDYAVKQDADVINLSLGSEDYSYAVETALANAHKEGVLVVASSGNSDSWRVVHPAAHANNLFTGWTRLSVTSVDSQDRKSDFANYGYNIELSAPGENIYGPAPDLQVTAWTGTSMAAPVVSGMLALALAEDTDLEAHDIAKLIMRNSSDLYNNDANQDYTYKLGHGRVDVAAFMSAVLE